MRPPGQAAIGHWAKCLGAWKASCTLQFFPPGARRLSGHLLMRLNPLLQVATVPRVHDPFGSPWPDVTSLPGSEGPVQAGEGRAGQGRAGAGLSCSEAPTTLSRLPDPESLEAGGQGERGLTYLHDRIRHAPVPLPAELRLRHVPLPATPAFLDGRDPRAPTPGRSRETWPREPGAEDRRRPGSSREMSRPLPRASGFRGWSSR